MSEAIELNYQNIVKWGTLGEGGQGTVFRAIYMNEPGYAMKEIKINDLYKSNTQAQTAALREIEINLHLERHENIVDFIGATNRTEFVGPTKKKEITTILLFKSVEGGNLLQNVFYGARPFTESIALFITRSIIIGIHYAHWKGVSILDIKLDNIMVDGDLDLKNWKSWIKLCDFGLSKLSEGPLNSFQGSKDYMSPQILLKENYYGIEADLFALAVCIFGMVVGRPPFSFAHPTSDAAYRKLANRQYALFWQEVEAHSGVSYSAEFKNLLTTMFQFNPNERLSLDNLYEHPWIQGVAATKEEVKMELELRRNHFE